MDGPSKLTPDQREANKRRPREAANALGSLWRNLREGSAYAHQGPRKLRKAVEAGHLRAARIGGRKELFFKTEWLDGWIENQTVPVFLYMYPCPQS